MKLLGFIFVKIDCSNKLIIICYDLYVMTLVFLHYYSWMKVVKVKYYMIFTHKDADRVGIFFWKKCLVGL